MFRYPGVKWVCSSDMTSTESEKELESRAKLLRLLDAVTDALVWAISRTGLSMQQQSARLAHLLMLLSHIRHLRYCKPLGSGSISLRAEQLLISCETFKGFTGSCSTIPRYVSAAVLGIIRFIYLFIYL